MSNSRAMIAIASSYEKASRTSSLKVMMSLGCQPWARYDLAGLEALPNIWAFE